MTWTVVDDDSIIQVRASINRENEQEIRELITALEKRITKKETDNERPTVT